jgi:flagellar hook-associated protein 3 FlgL
MRISSQQIFQPSVDAMRDLQRELSRVQEQLATGKRILDPADDPAGASQVLRLDEAISIYGQYQRNADAARSRLALEEGALGSLQNVLQRVREINVQGNNDTNSPENRRALAVEVRELLDNLVQLLNTRDGSGDYLFSGALVRGPAVALETDPILGERYVYQGDDGRREVNIGPGRTVAMGDPGSEFFELNAATSGSNIAEVVRALAVALEDGAGRQDTLTDLSEAIDAIAQVQAKIGARLNAIDDQAASNETAVVALEGNRSTIEDLDYAEAATRLNLQLTALQAAQQTFARIQGLSLFNYL